MIKNTVIEKINHVKMPPVINEAAAKFLEEEIQKWLKLRVQLHVFDFGMVLKIHHTIYGPMIKFKKEVEKAKEAKVISINLTPDILQRVQRDGMDSAIGYMKNIVNVDGGSNKDQPEDIKKWLIKYIGDSTRSGITAMFNAALTVVEEPSTPSMFRLEQCHKIVLIETTIRNVEFCLRLYFEKSCIEGLTKIIIGSSEFEPDLVDSTAMEIMNVIYDSAKSKLNNDRHYQLPPKIPQLIPIAQAEAARKVSGWASHWLTVTTSIGRAYVEISLRAQ